MKKTTLSYIFALAVGTSGSALAQNCNVRVGNHCFPNGVSGSVHIETRNGVTTRADGLPSDAYEIDPRTGLRISPPTVPGYNTPGLMPLPVIPQYASIVNAFEFWLPNGQRFVCSDQVLNTSTNRNVGQLCAHELDVNPAYAVRVNVQNPLVQTFKLSDGRHMACTSIGAADIKSGKLPISTSSILKANQNLGCLVIG